MNETKHNHERSAASISGTVIPSDVIAFGHLRLRVVERLLEKDGVRLKVGSRALDILIALVERAPEVVSKRELLARVWPGLVVDEGSLRFHIAALRKVLGDGQSGTRYVINVAGRGYCFAATILRSGAKPPPGDIAHEFNDIIGAILGYGELAQKAASADDPMRCYVDNILIAGQRAKSLVERLLATRSNNI